MTDILDPGGGPDLDEIAGGAAVGVAAAAGAALVCLSCSEAIQGAYCSNCGQRNDDLRRNSFVLARDFMRDTFGFDSRMWRTLGLMALAPGTVPKNYSHGRRSRYTPPVRLFLVVSFLFFLTLGLTKTMFVAVEITRKTPEQIAADDARVSEAIKSVDAELSKDTMVEIEGQKANCPINIKMKFFVRPADVKIDGDAWRTCAASIQAAAKIEMESDKEVVAAEKKVIAGFNRFVTGLTAAVEHPEKFNSDVNDWLARIMFLMTPMLALLLALFIRGKDALLFDHLVLSLYLHAAGFAVVGLGIMAAIAKVPYAAPVAAVSIGLYFLIALKRAYKRGWIKTFFAALFAGLFYLLILTSAATWIMGDTVFRQA
ncbi:MAG: DUF3667 domain-containing protein [Parvularculaceae bacterium]